MVLGDQPPGVYKITFFAQACVPIKTAVRTGTVIPIMRLDFPYGDADGDGRITAEDLTLLQDWKDRRPGASPTRAEVEHGLMPQAADWDGDGRITDMEVALARVSLIKK